MPQCRDQQSGTRGALHLVRRTFLASYRALAVRLLQSLEHQLGRPARAPVGELPPGRLLTMHGEVQQHLGERASAEPLVLTESLNCATGCVSQKA